MAEDSTDRWTDLAPPEPSVKARWVTEEFRDELRAWCASYVGRVTAMEQHKLRGWATVWRVSTADGVWFAKQNCPRQGFEVPLLAELARLLPDRVVPVTAAADGFLLTPDQGPTFRETVGDSLEPWERLVREGAELQRELAPYAGRLGALGLTHLEPDDAERYAALRIAELAALPPQDRRRLDLETARRLEAHLPVLRSWADQVVALGLPITLDHNDLHENNAFDVGGRLRFFDFGDSLLGGPLSTLMVPLANLAESLGNDPRDPRVWRAADAALEVWNDLASMSDLRAALPAALQLGRLGRVETWLRCLPTLDDQERATWGDAATGWLTSLLDPPFVRA